LLWGELDGKTGKREEEVIERESSSLQLTLPKKQYTHLSVSSVFKNLYMIVCFVVECFLLPNFLKMNRVGV